MRHFTRLAAIFAVLLLVAMPVVAQQAVNPNTVPSYFTHSIRSGASYANSSGDTTAGYRLGGTSKLSVIITAYDSVALDFYADYKIVGSPTWTQCYADSMLLAVDTLNVQEFVLRDNDHDSIDHVGVTLRFRVVHRSTGNGTTSATKRETIVFKQ